MVTSSILNNMMLTHCLHCISGFVASQMVAVSTSFLIVFLQHGPNKLQFFSCSLLPTGSIFIYSPGMVVLGTNASERREEMRQEGMERHLSSVPQQESRSTSSSSYPDSVGLSTQEEDEDKELSYPIPASGK